MSLLFSFAALVLFLWLVLTYGRWFAGVASGAPFVPLPVKHLQEGMSLLTLTSDDVVIDLGSGSGTILREVMKSEARAIGYEFHPWLVAWSAYALRSFGNRVQVRRGDLFQADISEATVITLFGLESMKEKIESHLRTNAHPGTRVLVFLAPELPFNRLAKNGWATLYQI